MNITLAQQSPDGTETKGLEQLPLLVTKDNEEVASTPWFALALSSVFCVLELVNILHHPMWRDEMQVWSLSQHSHSLLEFLSLKRYEDLGHPDAWHLLVYPISRLTPRPIAMQLLHLAIATITAYVVARYSPFPRIQRVLIVFGYFLFYEYAAISRDYAFGVLCVFCFCALFRPGPKKNYLTLAVVLALMAQANVQALILAVAFVVMMAFEAIRAPTPKQFLYPDAWRVGFAAMLFVASAVVSTIRMRPPADSVFYPAWHFSLAPIDVGRTLATMWKAFIPIPQFSRQFWNTNIVSNLPLVAALSVPVLLISVLFFLRKPTVLVLYTSGLGALLLFKHVKYAGYLRHDGHAYILFLACAWLAYAYPEEKIPLLSIDRIGEWFAPHARTVFLGLLTAQVAAGLMASAIALRVPFSQAKAAANFLRSQHRDRMFIVGDSDLTLATLAGYLGREIYYPRGDRMGTYIIWDEKRLAGRDKPIFEVGREKAEEQHSDVLVILNHPSRTVDHSVRELASFQGSIVGNENYFIYLIPYSKTSIGF